MTSADFAHGFALPDFGVRADLIPDRTIEVRITPMTAGRYHFLCDNFCGDGRSSDERHPDRGARVIALDAPTANLHFGNGARVLAEVGRLPAYATR